MASSNPLTNSKKQKAFKLLNQGRVQEAVPILEQIVNKYPKDIEALATLGNIYGQSGQLEPAVHYLQRVVEINPNDLDTLSNLGVANMMLGNIEQAKNYTERVVKQTPNDPAANYNLACILQEQNKSSEAIEYFKKALALEPGSTDIMINLGVAQKDSGKNAEALETFKKATELTPDSPEAFFNIGTIYSENTDSEKTIEYLKKAIELKPDYFEAHQNLSNQYNRIGDMDAARAHMEKAIASAPNSSEALLSYERVRSLANLNLHDGEIDKAVELYNRAIAASENDFRLYRELGKIHLDENNYKEAGIILHKALELDPDNEETLLLTAKLYKETSRHPVAFKHLKHALEINPENIRAHIQLSGIYNIMGDNEAALSHVRMARTLAPDNTGAKTTEIDILHKAGRYDEAIELFEPLLERPHKQIDIAGSFANLCKHMDRCDDAITYLNDVIQQGDKLKYSNRSVKRNALFELGKLYDSLKRYDKAFAAFKEANALKNIEFDCVHHHAYIDALQTTFSQEILAASPSATHNSNRPIFIVGMPRSGTSLTEQIIASHHAVEGAGELGTISQIYRSIENSMYKKFKANQPLILSEDECNINAQVYLDELQSLSETAAHVTDKMPTNFLYLGLIQQLFPQARIIHTLRNPLDVCVSIFSLDFAGSHPYAYQLENLGCFYNEYRRVMKFWEENLDIPIMHIRYDELVADQELWSRKLIDFCGLEWDENCLNFHKSKRVVYTASNQQVRQPMYKGSVERWRNYEKYLQPLIDALEPEYRKEAGVEN